MWSRWSFELVDLTRPLTEDTITRLLGDSVSGNAWADYRTVAISTVQDWHTANSKVSVMAVADHVGTHVDAPSHCLPDGPGAERIDIRQLIGEAVCIDLSDGDPDRGYLAADFADATPTIERGDIVLIYSGFRDCAPGDRVHQTYVTSEGAAWLVQRGVRSVGCEPGGLEHCWHGPYTHRWDDEQPADSPPWPAHRLLLAHDVYIIEGLTNLDRLVGRRVKFAALPLHVPGLSGSPVRAVAWIDDAPGVE